MDTLPRKSVLLIEEDIGNIKSILVQQIGYEMAKTGQTIYYFSTKKSKEDIINEMLLFGMKDVSDLSTFNIYEKNTNVENHLNMSNKDLLHFFLDNSLQKLKDVDTFRIDTFSLLYTDENNSDSLTDVLNSLLNISRELDLTILLTWILTYFIKETNLS